MVPRASDIPRANGSETGIQRAQAGYASEPPSLAALVSAEVAPFEPEVDGSTEIAPEHQGAFAGEPREPRNEYDLTLICRSTGGSGGTWRVTGALLKRRAEPSYWVPGHVDVSFNTDDTDGLLRYLEDKGGGNGFTYDSARYWVRSPDNAHALIAHYDASLALRGMSGAPALTAEKGQPPSPSPALLVEDASAAEDALDALDQIAEKQSALQILRVGPPKRIVEVGHSDAEWDELGGQPMWHFTTPWVFRALAAPSTFQPILAAPRKDDPLEHRCAYWTSLLYLLLYRLGWADPAAGLDWWQEGGFPVEDETLKLIHAAWVRDDRLHLVQTWLHQQARPFRSNFEKRCQYRPSVRTVQSWPEDPGELYGLGPAQLHLEDGIGRNHLTTAFEGDARTGTLLRSRNKDRRAVLITDSMIGWYGALIDRGAQLPELGGRSWRVDVVAKPVGFLGTYRRSRETGIWFTGRHSTHRAGT